MDTDQSSLRKIDPDLIDQNPDNPRLIFHEDEMTQLLESIRAVGIKVPLSVYEKGNRYVLIDGERRWRCARKLNLTEVPVVTQPEPTPLQNLLTMFNIHNVRQAWDLMPMAIKLAEVKRMLEAEGTPAKRKDLAGLTGLPITQVNRAFELLELPKKYRDMLIAEAKKPRDQQNIKPDLFVEVNKSKRVIQRYAPAVFEQVTDDEYVESMLQKYLDGVVNNVVRFRDVSKIARAELVGGDTERVVPVLVRLVRDKSYRIEDAFEKTSQFAYEARDIATRTVSLRKRLAEFGPEQELSVEVKKDLRLLREEISRLLGD
jgi:ParB family transcriptional regulator, chromosome partitioning protein